jgi:hypothetical protein
MHARAVTLVSTLVVALIVAACGSSGTAPTQAAGGFVTVADAWVRAREAGGTTAAYMTITNGRVGDDELVGVSAPEITNEASLHETTADGSGMTGMQHVDGIVVPAGQTVALEPGGYHVMLMNLLDGLEAGDRVTLTLTFEQTGPVDVTAEVRAG